MPNSWELRGPVIKHIPAEGKHVVSLRSLGLARKPGLETRPQYVTQDFASTRFYELNVEMSLMVFWELLLFSSKYVKEK